MKAAVYHKYGPPEVVQVTDVPQPVIKSNEVLIKVHASTVNRTDCGFRSAQYFISRFFSGLLKPKNNILGCEFAGQIESIGSDVTSFTVGQKVFGYDDSGFGGHAAYIAIAENKAVAAMPDKFSYTHAAALTEGAHYALCNIKAAKVKKGDAVMVYGATGAIGSAAVQLLKAMDIYVVAVCNTKNVLLIKSLGADEVIDYQTEDFTKIDKRFDFVFDAVGKISFVVAKPLLKEKGIYISTELGKHSQNVFLAMLTPLLGGKKVLFPLPVTKKEDILFLKKLAGTHQFKPIIDREYPLENIVEAYRYVETGQKTGNVVIKIDRQ